MSPSRFEVRPGWVMPVVDGVAADTTTSTVTTTRVDTDDGRLARLGIALERERLDPGGPGVGWVLRMPASGTPLRWADRSDVLLGLTGARPLVDGGARVSTRRVHRFGGSVGAVVVDDVVDRPSGRRRYLEVAPGADRVVADALRHAGARPHRERDRDRDRDRDLIPPQPVRKRDPAAGYAIAVVRADWARFLAAEVAVRLGADPESIHEARVALRRVRSDLRFLRRLLDPAWAEPVGDDLRWIAHLLGAVRDLDVLDERLAAHGGRHRDLVGVAELREALATERQGAHAEVVGALRSSRYLELVGTMEAGPVPLPRAAAPVGAALPRALARPWRRLARQVRDLDPSPGADDLHRVRIRAKQVRFAAEAVAPVLGGRAGALAGAAKELQHVLGEQHDAVEAGRWLRAAGTSGTLGAQASFAAGVLTAEETAAAGRLADGWADAWRDVAHAGRRLRRG